MRQLKIFKQITNRETPALDSYFREISKMPLLSAEEEVKLAERIRGGDLIAVEKLVNANLRFVVSVAKQYQNKGISLNDLINEGNVGLVRAASKFDETRGFKFISYAVWWIRQGIMQALAEQSRIVRLPLNRISSLNKILKSYSSLEQKYQREPSSEELSDVLDMTPEEVDYNIKISGKKVSIDAPFTEGENQNLLDTLENQHEKKPDAQLMDESLKKEINHALSGLSAREAEIIKLYFGLNGQQAVNLEEIGSKLNLTRERVRQIKDTATRKLRHGAPGRILKNYLF
ncbi:MAG: RNA polymerase sigma factor RpoD/SigA [Bacteroidota bacterium]